MLFQDRKAAIGFAMLLGIVASILAGGAALMTFVKVDEVGDNVLEGQDCKALLALQRGLDSIPLVNFDNNCKTEVVNVPQNKRLADENSQISKEIAKKMVKTWSISHHGTIKEMWTNSDDWLGSGSKCFVMYEINLEHIPKEGYTQWDLYNYLLETDYDTLRESERSYMDYIELTGKRDGKIIFPQIQSLKPGEEKKEEFDKTLLMKENAIYAISMISPEENFIEEWFVDRLPGNVLMFSELAIAEQDFNCRRRGGGRVT